MAEHNTLTDPQLHEPKGILLAGPDMVLVADGLGSGVWKIPLGLDTATEGQFFISDGNNGGTWTTPGGAQFGSAFFTGNAVASVISVIGTDYVVDPGVWAQTVTDTIVFDTNNFTVATTGIYELHLGVAFQGGGGGAGDTYRFSFGKAGVALATSPVARRQTASGDTGSAGVSTIQALTAGDVITVLVENETSINNPTISDASFTIVLLKETV